MDDDYFVNEGRRLLSVNLEKMIMSPLNSRLTQDEYYLRILELVSARSTCIRRAVGAIIVDGRGRVLSTGYNGVPTGFPHCIVDPCAGSNDSPGDSSNCNAVHAEVNAVIQCYRIDYAHKIYVSCSPCFSCMKMLLNTNIKEIVSMEEYADNRGLDLWFTANRRIKLGAQ